MGRNALAAAEHRTKKTHGVHLDTAPLHNKRILFATDFSPQASTAFRTAVRFSRHYGGTLYMAHVVSPMLYAPNGGVLAPALQQVEIKNANEKLGRYITRMPDLGAVEMKKSLPAAWRRN